MKATVPLFDTPYVLSTHAELRVLERTNLSGGQLLQRLNTRACVWLPRRGVDGEWYALVHCLGSQTYVVCVIADVQPVLKTVLTLEMWENDCGVLPFIWLALARTALVQSIAATVEPASGTTRPDGKPSTKDKPDYWVDCLLELAATPEGQAPALLALGRLNREELVSFGMEPPRSIMRPTWKNSFESQLRRLLKKADVHAWLLTQLAEHQDVVERATRLVVKFGVAEREAVRTLDMTETLVDALTAEPLVACTAKSASAGVADELARQDVLPLRSSSSVPVERLQAASRNDDVVGPPSPALRRTQETLQSMGVLNFDASPT